MNPFWLYPGKERFEELGDYVALDFETTGLNPSEDHIIEYGAVRVRNHQIIESYDCFVKIEDKLNPFIAELTKIDDELLNKKGIDEEEALDKFLNWLGDDVVLGQNVAFDLSFLLSTTMRFHKETPQNDYLDTLSFSRVLLPNLAHHRLSNLCEYYDIDNKQAHRALSDCIATKEVYDCLLKEIKDPLLFQETALRMGMFHRPKEEVNYTFNPNHILYGKKVSFSGIFRHFSKAEAEKMALEKGAILVGSISYTTDYLFIGGTGGKSLRYKKSELLIENGSPLKIADEDEFIRLYEME